jgi:hypothetical protein
MTAMCTGIPMLPLFPIVLRFALVLVPIVTLQVSNRLLSV